MNTRKNNGFIALTSVIILAAMLAVLVFTESTSSFFARYGAQSLGYRKISASLAESCVNYVFGKLLGNYDYDAADEEIKLGEDACIIQSVNEINEPSPECNGSPAHKCIQIIASAGYPASNGAWTKLEVVIKIENPKYYEIDSRPITILSWK